MHTTKKQIPFCNTVRDEILFDLVKIETENTRKRFYEDKQFKEGNKERCSPRIEEAEGRKTYIILFLNEKLKVSNMKDMKGIIFFKVLK